MGIIDGRKITDMFLQMNISTWAALLVAVITLATPGGATEARVVCYYTNWSVYRPGTARFNPQNINPYLCTHLIYAFGGFTKDNTLKPFDKYQDIEKGGYAKFTGLKTYNKELKTMLAIGGWNEGSTRFSPMVASRERRKEFVRNAIKFLRQNKFDGLDLDWEYPAFRDGGKPKDRENYAKLVKELREEFEKESEKTGRQRLLLTMAVPAGIEYIQKGFDVKTLNQYLDWMNLLTYDYHSAFEPAVNHHAPLYPLEEPNEYSVDNELNIDYTIKFYIENGADRDKLVLGIPTYGRSYTLFNADAVEIGSPADGPGEQGDATREKGYLAYYEICEALKPKEKKQTTPSSDEDSSEDTEEEDQPWTLLQPNPNAMGPVAYKGNQWVGYDDVDIVRKKAEYVADNGLGGIMFWSIDNDDFRGNCHDKPYPLIEAAKEAYIVGLGSTKNAVVTDRPRATTTRASARRKTKPRATTPRPTTERTTRKSAISSTTPSWNANTPEPPTTPDPGSDFKCTDEGFFQHPRDCKKYFWCLDSGPSNLGIVAHQFTCPSGLFFNKAADSCDFSRNVLCKMPSATTKAPTTKTTTTKAPVTTTTTTRRPIKLSTKSSVLFRTTTTTTPEPEVEEEYEEQFPEDPADIEAQDPKVLKELIDLIKKVGGVEQLEKQLHLDTPSASQAPGTATTTRSFNKQLYKKVLERTKKAKLNIPENSSQYSRRGPQNAGLEPAADKDRLLRKDRPQYTSIRRARPSTTADPLEEEIEEESAEVQQVQKARAVEVEAKVGTTTKPLQYVNIRRARPTSDTADDTASRNALFERPESFVSVTEPNSLDVSGARREHMPEYVTIRRQRPTTEEATTVQYSSETEGEERGTALEREISSPQQPQYISIVRSRPSTTLPPEEVSSPEPTTVLAVQISSLLNDPVDNAEITVADEKEDETTTSTTTTTTTTASPSSIPPRRIVQRRRGSTTTTTTTSTVAPASQVSSRNYTFVRRRRPIATPNEIVSDVDDNDSSRKIRSTTPNSREINEIKPREPGLARRNRFRLQTAKPEEDSVPAAASPVSRGQFRPQLSRDEVLSLTPLDAETPQFVQKPSFTPKVDRRFRSRTATTVADVIQDSEASAATVEASEARRPTFGTRGRGRFTPSSTTTAEPTLSTEAKPIAKRPTFARISPRPFGRPSTTIDEDEEENIEPVTQRLPARLPFGRSRPSSSTPTVIQARRLPFSSRISTTRQPLGNENEDTVEEEEERHDDITLSESAIAEKEHEENEEVVSEQPKRRIIVKKLRAPVSSTTESPATTEAITDENGRKKIRVIRRRPTSTTETLEDSSVSTEPTPSSTPTRIRKIIRKKIKPVEVEDEPNIIAKSINSLNTALKDSTTEVVVNYGEKSRPFSGSTAAPTETETKPDNIVEEINAMKEESKSQAPEEPQKEPTEIEAPPPTEELLPPKEYPQTPTESTPDVESDSKPEVVVESEQKAIDLSENKEELSTEVSEEPKPETTTTTTTQAPSSTSRARGPYRPLKRIFTSTTESVPSSSRTFSRKYNPGAYTSPSTVEKTLDKAVSVSTRRTFTARTFTRRPFTTARTTKKAEEEYDDSEEEIQEEEEEPEEENPIVLVPQNQLFSRRPTADEETEENEEEEVPQNRFTPSSRKPSFKPRVVNSNTFRTSTTTTELPKRLGQNRTAIFNRFGGAKPANDAKKRVQNVPIGYGKPSEKPNETLEPEKEEEVITTTNDSTDEFTTTEDDYLSGTEASTESSGTTPEEATSTNTVDSETATFSMDFDNSTDDFLDFSDSTTNYPSTQDSTSDGNTGPVDNISFISTSPYPEYHESTTTEADTKPTTSAQQVTPVVKTQFNKLFSISRSVEVSSKLDKHRLNKHNETKLIEEGKVMVETKPRVDKIGEVSRYSLIKIVEDEIPIYLTKLGHVYPVENPPDNLIRIDEARNARALVNFADAPRENLIASESMNEAYRHVSNQVMNLPKDDTTDKGVIEHLIGDDFLSYVNEDTSKKNEKTDSYVDEQTYQPQWQFVPAAYENERNREGKSYDIITPRSAFTEPSTLPLEGLFKTDTPLRARKVGDGQQPFVVYSASLPNQKEEGNIVKLSVIKPEAGRSIITFAKGQEFNGASVTEEATVKYPVNIAVLSETEATPPATTVIEELRTSPLIEMLTTPTTLSTESPTIVTTGAPTTTEAITEETTTTKSVFDTKRSKFAFPRRPAIKPANLSRLSAPRAATKKNATTNGNLPQKTIAKGNLPPKVNKTSSYSSSKSRFTANRGQNVPVDIRKKSAKLPLKSVTTETPRTTTEKRLLYKSIRPIRPAFVPRRSTTPPPTEAGDT